MVFPYEMLIPNYEEHRDGNWDIIKFDLTLNQGVDCPLINITYPYYERYKVIRFNTDYREPYILNCLQSNNNDWYHWYENMGYIVFSCYYPSMNIRCSMMVYTNLEIMYFTNG